MRRYESILKRSRSQWHALLLGVSFFYQAEDGIRDLTVTGVQTCALPIFPHQVFPEKAACDLQRRPGVERGGQGDAAHTPRSLRIVATKRSNEASGPASDCVTSSIWLGPRMPSPNSIARLI